MEDHDKTQNQLIDELNEMRRRVAELETAQATALDTQNALRESEERFRTLFETANDAIFLMDNEKFIECNAKALQMFGCEEEKDIVGHTPMEFSPDKQPDGLDSLEKALKYINAASNSNPQTFYWKHCRKDGSPFDAEVSLNALTLNGKVHLQTVVRDVTERKRIEEAILKSEEKYRRIVETANEGLCTLDKLLTITLVNKKMADMLGYGVEEIIGKKVEDFMFADDLRDHEMKVAERHQGQAGSYERRFRQKDGTTLWTLVSSTAIMDQDGNFNGSFAMVTDITNRKRMEGQLRESEQRLELALEGGAIGLWDWNLKTGRAVLGEWATRMRRNVGYEQPPNIRNWKRAVHPDDWEKVSETLKGHLSGRHPFYEGEYRLRNKSGEWRWCHARGKVVEYDKEGKPQRMIGTMLDVTERKRAEDALRESEERYRAVVDNAGVGINWLDQDGKSIGANQALSNMLGYSIEEFKELTFSDITHPDDREISRNNLQALMAGDINSYKLEKRYLRKDGDIVWGDLSTSVIRNVKGEIVGTVGVIADITERKRLEEEKENLIIDLQKALSKVKTLSGFLPICASCKKIRDDKGYWNEVERYIGDHSEALFSHGICPDCMRKLYPEYADEVLRGLEKDEKK